MLPKSLKNILLLSVAMLVIATGVSVSQLVAHQYSLSLLDGAAARAENIAHKLSLDAVDKILINDLVAAKDAGRSAFKRPNGGLCRPN